MCCMIAITLSYFHKNETKREKKKTSVFDMTSSAIVVVIIDINAPTCREIKSKSSLNLLN